MEFLKRMGAFVARFFISAIFLASGVHKIIHWQATEREFMDMLAPWETYSAFSELAREVFSFVVAQAPLFLVLGTLLELLGGLLLLLGAKERLGAGFLILFLIPVTILFHPFWFIEGTSREVQVGLFLRNAAIFGGLLVILLRGTQAHQNGSYQTPYSME